MTKEMKAYNATIEKKLIAKGSEVFKHLFQTMDVLSINKVLNDLILDYTTLLIRDDERSLDSNSSEELDGIYVLRLLKEFITTTEMFIED